MTHGMARPWKHPKTGVYWLSKRVPTDLQKKVGKSELRRNLGTKDPTQAKLALAQQLAAIEQSSANLRHGSQSLRNSKPMSWRAQCSSAQHR